MLSFSNSSAWRGGGGGFEPCVGYVLIARGIVRLLQKQRFIRKREIILLIFTQREKEVTTRQPTTISVEEAYPHEIYFSLSKDGVPLRNIINISGTPQNTQIHFLRIILCLRKTSLCGCRRDMKGVCGHGCEVERDFHGFRQNYRGSGMRWSRSVY